MSWMSVALAAASGAAAAVLAMLIVGNQKERRALYAAVAVLLFFALNFVSRQYILPRLDGDFRSRNAEKELLEIPAFAAIKKYDPATFNSLLNELKQGLKEGQSESQLIGVIRSHMTGIIQSRLPGASGEAVLAYMKVMITELKTLQGEGGDLCFRFLFPQTSAEPLDGRKYFTKELQAKDLAALADVIRTSATERRPKPLEAEVMPTLRPIVAELSNEYGNDVQMLQNPTAPGTDKTKVCAITIKMYEKIFRLPDEDSGRLLRFLLTTS